ncbi:MAG: hypothetical protein ABI132_00805 [Rhodanobacteraceae bacterium]
MQREIVEAAAPAEPPEPALHDNPLGEWYGDIDFIDRQPFVLLINAATGLVLVLPGRAEHLRDIEAIAAGQLWMLMNMLGVGGALADAEVDAWSRTQFARTTNRSMVASMNQRKFEAWTQFAYNERTAFETAQRLLETPFSRMELGRGFHFAADLVRARLQPADRIIPMQASRTPH